MAVTFEPIRTERLVLRAPQLADAEAEYQRRHRPEVARYQDWAMPYTRQMARDRVAAMAALGGPTDGREWAATVTDAAAPERILGDVYLGIKWGGRSAEIGYTLHPDHWGEGYATEAAQAAVRYLFDDHEVYRVEASLHPGNVPSARVLEASGLVYEGLARQAFWRGDECSDGMFYGVTRSDWEAWRDRPRHAPERVELVPVTAENRRAVGDLVTHKSQERFVPIMLANFRDALAPPALEGVAAVPWFRAIEADGAIAGFLMAGRKTGAHPNPYLWRLLIDRLHQRRGIGRAALDRFEDWCRDEGATAVETSWAEGPGSPARFYLNRGYKPTGRTETGGSIHAIKPLA